MLIAYDPDFGGEQGAERLAAKLRSVHVKPERWRPLIPGKDWNDILQAVGITNLTRGIYQRVFPYLELPACCRKPTSAAAVLAVGTRVSVGDRQGRITALYPADAYFPAGWCRLITDDGIGGEADLSYVTRIG